MVKAMTEAPILTNEYIKQQADKLLLESGYASQFPVLIEKIAEFLGFKLYSFKPDEKTSNLSGFVNHREKRIYTNKEDSTQRKIVTIAHEIGHIVLHGAHLDHVDYKKSTSLNLKERQADEFAACILMPENVFKQQYIKFRKNYETLADFFYVPLSEVYLRASHLRIGN